MPAVKRVRRRLRGWVLPALVRGLAAIFGRLPLAAAQRAGAGISRLAWTLALRDRRRALDHLAVAFPDAPEEARQALGRASFRHHRTTLAECLHLFRSDCRRVEACVRVEG